MPEKTGIGWNKFVKNTYPKKNPPEIDMENIKIPSLEYFMYLMNYQSRLF